MVIHRKEGRGNSSSSPRKLRFNFFVEKTCEACQSAALPSTRTGVSHTNDDEDDDRVKIG